VVLTTSAVSAEDSVYSAYLTLVERCCSERDKALRALSRWSPEALEEAKKGLYECEGCRRAWPERFPLKPPSAVDLDCGCDSPPWEAAAALHTLRAFTSEPGPTSQYHLAFAARLQENVTNDTFRRRWYVVAGLGGVFRGDLALARSTLRQGLERFEGDPDLLVALGASYEVEEWRLRLGLRSPAAEGPSSTQKRTDQRAERSRCWTDAADRYEQALDRDPEHPEAHLRLGRVELLLGRTERGLAELRWVTAHAAEPDLISLANLFTGREQKRSGQPHAALASYRAALEADPSGQAAAVATSQALLMSGDPAAAADVLQRGLAARRRTPSGDGWSLYPEGRPGQLVGLLTRLHQEVCR